MSNPASQPRKLFLAALVLVTLGALVALLTTGHLALALVVGPIGMGLLILAARPSHT